jgi:hypothetical protein
MKEKVSCQGLSQLTDFAPLAPALARFGRVGREATNQKAGSSNPPGRTIFPIKTRFSENRHVGFNSLATSLLPLESLPYRSLNQS